jgi:hypothetical protein
MVEPILYWTEPDEAVGLWLKEVLQACSPVQPALPITQVASWQTAPETFSELNRAGCFFGVLAPVKAADSPYSSGSSGEPSKEFMAMIRCALDAHLPCNLIIDQGMHIPDSLHHEYVRMWQVDFSDPAALLALVPSIVRVAVARQWRSLTYDPRSYTTTSINDEDCYSPYTFDCESKTLRPRYPLN